MKTSSTPPKDQNELYICFSLFGLKKNQVNDAESILDLNNMTVLSRLTYVHLDYSLQCMLTSTSGLCPPRLGHLGRWTSFFFFDNHGVRPTCEHFD